MPQAKIVDGFQPIMPTFQGLVTEEQLLQLIAYIKSLQGPAPGAAEAPSGAQRAPAPAAEVTGIQYGSTRTRTT